MGSLRPEGGSVATIYPSRLAHRSAPDHDLRTTTMAVPKKKTSKSKSRSRRASAWTLNAPSRSVCPRCGAAKVPHVVCGNCGWYHGRQAIEVD